MKIQFGPEAVKLLEDGRMQVKREGRITLEPGEACPKMFVMPIQRPGYRRVTASFVHDLYERVVDVVIVDEEPEIKLGDDPQPFIVES